MATLIGPVVWFLSVLVARVPVGVPAGRTDVTASGASAIESLDGSSASGRSTDRYRSTHLHSKR